MNNIPNCVPEYYRSMWEDECHEAEKELERLNWYERNKEYRKQKYIDGCNELRFFPDECCKCQYGEETKPDSEMDMATGWRLQYRKRGIDRMND